MGPVPEIVRGNMDPSSNDYTLKALQLSVQCEAWCVSLRYVFVLCKS